MSRKTKTTYLFLFTLILIVYGFMLAFVIIKTDKWRIAKSTEYLYEAKNKALDTEKLLLFEKAAVLKPSEETYLVAGVTALKLGNNDLAEHYLRRVKTADGYSQLANSYYNLEKFDLAVLNYQKAINNRSNVNFYIGLAKSQLKQGNVDESRTSFEKAYSLQKNSEVVNFLTLLGSRVDVSNVTVSEVVKKINKETDLTNKAILIYNELNRLGYPHSADKVLQDATDKGQISRDSLFTLAQRQIEEDYYETAYTLLQQARVIDPYYPQIYKQLILVCEKLDKADEAKQYQEFYSKIVF